jgi:hypothetical protein
MTLRTTLFSGIAGLAIAGAVAFGAQAQPHAVASRTMWQQGVMMPSGYTSPSVVRYTKYTVRHRAHRYAQGMPTNDSTPAEKAATERLNLQQLAAARPSTQT